MSDPLMSNNLPDNLDLSLHSFVAHIYQPQEPLSSALPRTLSDRTVSGDLTGRLYDNYRSNLSHDESGSGTIDSIPHFPWLDHYEEGVPYHLDLPDRPLTWLLDRSASRYPNQTAFIYYGARTSYAQFSALANRFAVGLQRLGVKKGDRVAIALANTPHYPIAFYGALRAGAIVVPTNPLYKEHEFEHQLVDSEARVLVMLDMCYPVVKKIRQQTLLEHIIVASPADFLPPLLHLLYPLNQRRTRAPQVGPGPQDYVQDSTLHKMQSMLVAKTKGGVEVFNLPVPTKSDELAVLQYTGGTTGLAKGAMLTHRNLLANALQTWRWVPRAREGQEISLCIAPFFHAYGMTVGMNLSIAGGATMLLVPRFKAHDTLHLIKRYSPTLFPGIPTLYAAIVREAQKSKHPEVLRSIKNCISGAAPLPSKIRQDFEALSGGTLVEGYGLSEAAPVTHCNPLTDECRDGSIGLPVPGVEAAILDRSTGEPVAIGEIGEIAVKGPNIMQGYWKQSDENASIFLNGWMRTGDIGKMDQDGYFYVVERAKDLIIASGFNVYPREVEDVLYHHPAIAEVAVSGVNDSYRGETVAAFIVLKLEYEASEKTRADIIAYCRSNMAGYKVPRIIEFRKSLPKSTVGKVLRRELRREFHPEPTDPNNPI